MLRSTVHQSDKVERITLADPDHEVTVRVHNDIYLRIEIPLATQVAEEEDDKGRSRAIFTDVNKNFEASVNGDGLELYIPRRMLEVFFAAMKAAEIGIDKARDREQQLAENHIANQAAKEHDRGYTIDPPDTPIPF